MSAKSIERERSQVRTENETFSPSSTVPATPSYCVEHFKEQTFIESLFVQYTVQSVQGLLSKNIELTTHLS